MFALLLLNKYDACVQEGRSTKIISLAVAKSCPGLIYVLCYLANTDSENTHTLRSLPMTLTCYLRLVQLKPGLIDFC